VTERDQGYQLDVESCTWTRLPDLPDKPHNSQRDATTEIGNGSAIFSIRSYQHRIYSVKSKTWRKLQLPDGSGSAFTDLLLHIVDANGDEVSVALCSNSRIIEI
jgi:hypothetical protein